MTPCSSSASRGGRAGNDFLGSRLLFTRPALLELYLARAIGTRRFVTLAENFLRDDGHGISGDTIGARLTALTGVPGGFKP